MQITPDQLLAEAGAMALELRLKDQAITALEAEVTRLRMQLTPESDTPDRPLPASGGAPDAAPQTPHGHSHASRHPEHASP
jgi:hypothetical protein